MTAPRQASERIQRLQQGMARAKIDLVAVGPGSDLRYLLGFTPLGDERLCALIVGRDDLRFIVPSLNAEQTASHTGLDLVTWTDEQGPGEALRQVRQALQGARTMAFDGFMRADSLIPLREAFGPERLALASEILGPMRLCKTAEELDCLARSARLADRAVAAVVAALAPGKTEAEVGQAAAESFLRDGAELVDFVIIASGPNGAFPHHHTSDRRLATGDAVIMDLGATLGGYKSDITRMAHLGAPSAEFRRVYDAVLAANERARAAVRPGVPAREVDHAARGALEERGLAEYFIHRTGHGLGLDTHEPPYITATSDTILEPGMVFSIEPGVYLPGKFGVRIEDIVAVTESGVRVLAGFSYELSVR